MSNTFDQKEITLNFLSEETKVISKQQFGEIYELLEQSLSDEKFNISREIQNYFEAIVTEDEI